MVCVEAQQWLCSGRTVWAAAHQRRRSSGSVVGADLRCRDESRTSAGLDFSPIFFSFDLRGKTAIQISLKQPSNG
jgi:hypothetical protein